MPVEKLPKTVKEEALKMAIGVKECAFLLRECVNKMMTKPEEALQAKRWNSRSGESALRSLETIADSCEDACGYVRVITVRR